MDQQTIMLYVQ